MTTQRAIRFMSPAQTRQLTALAERACLSLSRFSGTRVEYNAVGIQMLDEWIDRHIRQFPRPSQEIVTIWAAFLGEVFRRRFKGEWALDTSSPAPRLGVLCPREDEGVIFVDVMDQIQRRITQGMSQSLSYYYTVKGMEIKGWDGSPLE